MVLTHDHNSSVHQLSTAEASYLSNARQHPPFPEGELSNPKRAHAFCNEDLEQGNQSDGIVARVIASAPLP
jgi:hypothetical protein